MQTMGISDKGFSLTWTRPGGKTVEKVLKSISALISTKTCLTEKSAVDAAIYA